MRAQSRHRQYGPRCFRRRHRHDPPGTECVAEVLVLADRGVVVTAGDRTRRSTHSGNKIRAGRMLTATYPCESKRIPSPTDSFRANGWCCGQPAPGYEPCTGLQPPPVRFGRLFAIDAEDSEARLAWARALLNHFSPKHLVTDDPWNPPQITTNITASSPCHSGRYRIIATDTRSNSTE